MESPQSTQGLPPLRDATRRMARRLFSIFDNRFQLLMVEVQEERERVTSALCLAVVMIFFGLLAGITLTALVVVAFWDRNPIIVLLILSGIYLFAAGFAYTRLIQLQKDWETLPTTIEQLRKDRECLEKQLT